MNLGAYKLANIWKHLQILEELTTCGTWWMSLCNAGRQLCKSRRLPKALIWFSNLLLLNLSSCIEKKREWESEREGKRVGRRKCVCVGFFFFALSVVVSWCWRMIRGGISLAGGAQSLKRLLGQNWSASTWFSLIAVKWDYSLCVCVCVCGWACRRANKRSWGVLSDASQVKPLDCGGVWLELLLWKGVISILVNSSATILLTSPAHTPCMHTHPHTNTHPAFASLHPPSSLMKCPWSHYLKREREKKEKRSACTYRHRSSREVNWTKKRKEREALENKRGEP